LKRLGFLATINGKGGCVKGYLVAAVALVILGIGGASADRAPAVSLSPASELKRCKPGFRHALIGRKHECLRRGARCRRRLDRQYHRYGFHCHSGRLTRARPRPAPPKPPPPPPPPSLTSFRLEIAGPEEVVFDWTTDRCDDEDVPDLPARAFRDADGNVHLFATHYIWRRAVGPTLDSLRHQCQVLHRFHGNPDPAAFDDREWLAATYTEDGRTIHALVHNEYQGHLRPDRCQGSYDQCWYNAITLAVSSDAGASWQHAPPPEHLIGAHHRPYAPLSGPLGLFRPSNLFRNPSDGHVYAFVHQIEEQGSHLTRGVCLMRTRTVADPRSWRAWSGGSFDHQFVNPYAAAARPCAYVDWEALHEMGESVAWNEELRAFVMVGSETEDVPGRGLVGGFWFSFSRDLIEWTPRQRFMEAEFPWTYSCGDPDVLAYPSLLDPASPSRNFDVTGRRAYVYFTRIHYVNCQMTLDRDLVRVPVEWKVAP
jgi:hypothetical protein